MHIVYTSENQPTMYTGAKYVRQAEWTVAKVYVSTKPRLQELLQSWYRSA